MLVACDVHRPAAAEQLAVLGGQLDVPVHREDGSDAAAIARRGIEDARRTGRDLVIVDTAGRLTIDAEMMDELVRDPAMPSTPTSVVLVLDAMTGQTAVEVAKAFTEAVDVDGRRAHQARRRRPRRRRPVGARRHRRADPVRRAPARSSTRSSPSTPTAWPRASSGWATS